MHFLTSKSTDLESLNSIFNIFRRKLSLGAPCPFHLYVQWAFISLFSVRVFLSQQNHMESCLLLIVSCTNNNCTETMIRKDLDKHVTIGCQWRLVHCSYCNEPQPKCQGEVIIILSQLCFKPTAPCSQQKPFN